MTASEGESSIKNGLGAAAAGQPTLRPLFGAFTAVVLLTAVAAHAAAAGSDRAYVWCLPFAALALVGVWLARPTGLSSRTVERYLQLISYAFTAALFVATARHEFPLAGAALVVAFVGASSPTVAALLAYLAFVVVATLAACGSEVPANLAALATLAGLVALNLPLVALRRQHQKREQSRLAAERQLQALVASRSLILQLIAQAQTSAPEVLQTICQQLETQVERAVVAVMALRPDDGRLYVASAPNLPQTYLATLESGVGVAPDAGSCGAAAHARAAVMVSDMASDACWAGRRQLAPLPAELRACWSFPLLAREGEVLGTIAVYAADARLPSAHELVVARAFATLATIVVEKTLAEARYAEQQVLAATTAKMAALGETSAGIAHEISNPLTVIVGRARQLQLLCGDAELQRKQLEAVALAIASSADRVVKIVNGMRKFSQQEAQSECAPVLVARLVSETLMFCGSRFRRSKVTLEVHEIPADLTLECRGTQVSQVLLNLLNNAHDAVEKLSARWVRLEVEVAGDRINFVVTDSGSGIPAEVRRKMFQPFFTTKGAGKGTGLGLSISIGIVRDHGGVLEVDGTSPNTRFVVSFPARAAALHPATAAA